MDESLTYLANGVIDLLPALVGGVLPLGLMGSIVLRGRYLAPKQLAEVERIVESGTGLGNALLPLRRLACGSGIKMSVPKKIRDRAEELLSHINDEYLGVIEREVEDNLPYPEPSKTMVDLDGWVTVDRQNEHHFLRNLSETYRRHFLEKGE